MSVIHDFCQLDQNTTIYLLDSRLLFVLCALVKFMYSKKATKFCKIFTVDLTVTTQDKSTVEISKKIVAFSEYMNFTAFNKTQKSNLKQATYYILVYLTSCIAFIQNDLYPDL